MESLEKLKSPPLESGQNMYFTSTSGQKLYYEIHGQGYPIVFFHGNNQSVAYFKPQLHLADRYQLILVDSPGHGQSGALKKKTSFAQMARDVYDLLESLHLDQYVLVGHSDGANLAIAYENLFPHKVGGLLLNAGNIDFFGLLPHYIFSISMKVIKLALGSIFSPEKRNAYHVAQLMMAHQTIVPSPFSDNIPVFVLVGQRDMIRPGHSLKIAEQYNNSRLITIPNMGHNVNKKPGVLDAVLAELMLEVVKDNQMIPSK